MYTSCSCFTEVFGAEVTEHKFPYSTIIPSQLEGVPAVCDGDRLVEQRPGAVGALLGWALLHPSLGWAEQSHAEPGPLALPLQLSLFTNDLTAASFPLNPAKSPSSPWQLMLLP